MNECIGITSLINDAASQNKTAYKALFDQHRSTLEDFFCQKIFNKIPQEKSKLDGLGDLCEITFSRVLDEIKNNKIDISAQEYDFKKHCLNTASDSWNNLIKKINNGDGEAFNKLFVICRKPLLGHFRGNVYPYLTIIEDNDLLHDAYIIALQRLKDNPYTPEKYKDSTTFYSYLKSITYAKYLAKRPKTTSFKLHNNEEISIIYRNKREIVMSSLLSGSEQDDSGQDPIEQMGEFNSSDPEDNILLRKDIEKKITEKIKEEKRRVSIKLATLEFCAYCSKPHQFLAFGFNKWLRSNPRKIVKLQSFTKFNHLSQELMEETFTIIKSYGFFKEQNLIENTEPRESFAPLLDKLEKSTSQIYKDDENESLVSHYGSSAIKDLSFSVFYEEDKSKIPDESWKKWPETQKKKYQKKISDWTDKVRKSTMNGLTLRKIED